uniref:uncharacterized threonine-rich GPI-anchored glycoprotein PJ4664.02-like n=1 Tax=Erigeron canadensis TaxID=72917 RepID=UPI001CB99A78|nr:uncharacterized threonine-rich GPI-anchored glycoprotein PJ4664.02-like [Erigeron canadensis]
MKKQKFELKLSKKVFQNKKKGSLSKKLKEKAPVESSSPASSEETVSIVGSPKPIRSPPPKTSSLRSSSPKTPSPQHSSTSSSSSSTPKSPQMPIHQSSPLPEFNSPIPPTMEPSQSQTIISQIPSSSSLPLSPTPTYFQNRRKSIPVNIQKNFKRSRFEDAHDSNETDFDDETANKFADDVMDIPEGQGGNEGGVENTREVKRSGLGERQKENVGLHLVQNIYKRRVPRIEVESSQLSQGQTSVSHSKVSQQPDVSSLHEQNPRTPFHSPSESVNVETQETPAPLLDFISALSSRTQLRIHFAPFVIPYAHLGDVAGITASLSDTGVIYLSFLRDSGCEAESSTVIHSLESTGNPETVMMFSGHLVDSLEATAMPDSDIPLPPETQRLVSQFVEGIEEGQRSELLIARNVITGKLPVTETRSPPRLRTGGALVIRTPVVSTFPSTTTTPPSIQSTPPTSQPITSSTPLNQSIPDPSSPHHSSSSSSSSESSTSTEYLSDCSPNRLATSGLPTDTLIVSLMNRLSSEEPNLTSHKRTIFHSLQAYLSHQETERTKQAEVEALQKSVRELDQQCRLVDISRSREDQDPDDQPEGENIRDIEEGHETQEQIGQEQNPQDVNQEQTQATSTSHVNESDSDELPIDDLPLPPLVQDISQYYSTTSDESSDHDPFQAEKSESESSDSSDPNDAPVQSQQETYGKDIFEETVYHLSNPENLETPNELAQGVIHPRISSRRIWQINEGYFVENNEQIVENLMRLCVEPDILKKELFRSSALLMKD